MTKFTKSIIRVILPLASLGFFLIASVVVLIISQGRTINEDGTFVQTGIIRINSIPTDNVKAYINDNEVSYSEFRITNITPGIVTLKLTKDGYTPWVKQVKVESGIVKDVYAQLYPNTIPFTKISTVNVNKTFYSSDGQFIYYVILNDSSLDGIWRIKLTRNLLDFSNSQQISQIVKFNTDQRNELKDSDYTIESSVDNNKFILHVGTNYYIYNIADTSIRTNLNLTLGFNPENVKWFRDSQSLIFTQDNKYSFEYDLTVKQISLIDYSSDSLSNFAVSANNVYFLKNNKLMVYTNKSSLPYVFSDKIKTLLPTKISSVYTSFENPNVLILDADGTLLYVDIQKDFIDVIDTNSTFYKALSNGRLINYFKDDELHSFYVEDNFADNLLDTSNFNLAIKRSAFTSLEFASTGRNLILFSNNKITLMDYDGLNVNTILTEFNFIENKLLFANNSTEMYALIQEKDEIGNTVNNIYKFELKLK